MRMFLASKAVKLLGVGTENLSVRETWLRETLKKIPPGARILDAGAGEQKYKSLCAHLNYVAQDFAQYDGRGDGLGLQTGKWAQSTFDIVSDITAIPQPDASFDAILCVEVFEHLPNPLAALKEFRRLLKTGGYLILTAPFCSLTHLAPYHFYSGFNSYFYERHLKDNGFAILEMERNGNYFEYLAQELLRLKEVTERYCTRRISIFSLGVLAWILFMLKRLSRTDRGSSELLCYGIHVFAQKIRP